MSLREVNEKLYEALEFLFESHLNNGGKVDFSEKDYSYILTDLETVEVLYFEDETADSDYAQEIRELLVCGEYSLLSDEEAFFLLSTRIANTSIL